MAASRLSSRLDALESASAGKIACPTIRGLWPSQSGI